MRQPWQQQAGPTSQPCKVCSHAGFAPLFDRMVLLIRHAERTEVTDIRTHAAAMLTEQGRKDSLSCGRMLGRRLGKIVVWHSPVPRCEATAFLLAEGASRAHESRVAGCLPWLGGDFISGDPHLINDQIAAHGQEGFLRRWFNGCYSSRDIAPLARSASIELNEALRQLQNSERGVIVNVTHDWNLILLREAYMNLRHEEIGTPPYLDSVAILKQANRFLIWSLGRTVLLPDPL